MPRLGLGQNMQNKRIRDLEARISNLESRAELTAHAMVKMIDQLFDLKMGAKHAEASMREVSTVLSAKEERLRVDRNEAARRCTGTARNGSS